MSKLSDYAKFDHLDEDDSGEFETDSEQKCKVPSGSSRGEPRPSRLSANTSSIEGSTAKRAQTKMWKDETTGRFVFECNGSRVYEWDQTLDDVTIYVAAPPFVKKGNQLKCILAPNRLKLGLQGSESWFINEETFETIDVSESTWSLEEDVSAQADGSKRMLITIYFTKAHRGQLWETALKGIQVTSGATLDPQSRAEVQKNLLLERFQEEIPGMDFRGAEFNGSVPDARTFMGGVKYS